MATEKGRERPIPPPGFPPAPGHTSAPDYLKCKVSSKASFNPGLVSDTYRIFIELDYSTQSGIFGGYTGLVPHLSSRVSPRFIQIYSERVIYEWVSLIHLFAAS
jgi:hypothetical protein